MRNWVPVIVGLIAVVALVIGFSEYANRRLQKDTSEPASNLVGKPAPDFQGDFAINGKPIKLSDLKGKVVLIDFWAVWCGPCIGTFPHLREWYKDYHQDGLEIVGLTMYNQADVNAERAMLKNFAGKHQLDYLLMPLQGGDFDRTTAAYGVNAFPTVVLIDRQGIVRLVRVGGGDSNARAIGDEIKKLVATAS